jgi:hypothetical protein
MRTSFSVEHEASGKNCESREDGPLFRPLTLGGGVCLKDGRRACRHCARDSIGLSDVSGGIVRSGRIDNAENISVAVLIVWLIDSASSQAQLVDRINSFNAGEGHRVGDTRGSTRKVSYQRGPIWLRFGFPFWLGWVHMETILFGRSAFFAEAHRTAIIR